MTQEANVPQEANTAQYVATALYVGDLIMRTAYELAVWSQNTFGSDQRRGPLGALKHLEKEAREAQAEPSSQEEYADCLLLVLDASRRAGMKPLELLEAAHKKLQVNKGRQWPEPVSDEPVEHVRG